MSDVDIDVDVNTADAVENVRRLALEVNRLDDRIRRADDTTRKFERRVGGSFRQALQDVRVLLGAIGIGVFVREMVTVNAAFEQVKTTLVAASNSMHIVASDFAFIRSEAVRLGMPVAQVGGEFAKLAAATRGTKLEGGPAREIYSALAEAFVATGQGADEFRLAVLAVNQMVSKGRVQAEELRGQLGERLPGAYQAAARAAKTAGITMNGTTAELSKALELGQVTAEKLLPALGDELRAVFGDAFKVAQSSPRFVMGQFQVAVENLMYTLSNQGFMVEFLGLLKDLNTYLSSEEGTRGAERLGSALGFMMAAVRDVANTVVSNIEGIVTVFAGLGSGAAVLGLRQLVGWIGNLAKASGMMKLLAGPWGWLATAIGLAVSLVAGYGDALMTLGGQTARLGDWFRATFQVGSEAIRNDLIPALNDMIVKIPYVGETLIAAGSAIDAFKKNLGETRNITSAINAGWASFISTLNGQGEIGQGVASFFLTMQNTLAATGPLIQGVVQFLRDLTNTAMIAAQEFGAYALSLGASVWNSLKGIGGAIWTLLSDIGTLIGQMFGQMDWQATLGGLGATITWVIDIVLGLVTTTVDLIELAVDLVADLFGALMPVIEPIATAIGAVLAKIVEYVKDIFNLPVDTTAWDLLKLAIGGVLVLIAAVAATAVGVIDVVANVLGQTLTAVFGVVGDVWSAIEDVITTVMTVFEMFAFTSQDTAVAAAKSQVEGAEVSKNGWVIFGDVIIGVFLSAIEIIGQVIRQVGNLVDAVAKGAGRLRDLFNATRDGMEAMKSGDLAGAKAARDQLTTLMSTPLDLEFGKDWSEFTAGFADNFNVISGAVGKGKDTLGAFGKFATDVQDNFGGFAGAMENTIRRTTGAGSGVQSAARESGEQAASSYIEGFGARIAERASGLTDAATEQQRLLNEAQALAAQDAARAYAEREAGIDRTPETLADKKKGGGRGGKSAGERARDRIKELAVEITMNEQLTQSLINQDITREQLQATIKATETLRRAGYDMTYDDAIKNGGMARELAAIAYAAEISEMALRDAKKQAEALGDISLENTGLETQIRAARELTANRKDYAFQTEATNELVRNNINLTYQEAVAAGGLAAKLAQVAYRRAQLKDQLAGANRVADAIEGYKREAQTMEMYSQAAARGVTSTTQLDAAVAGQKAVMDATGETVWRGVDALNASERALYDHAYTQSIVTAAGGNMQNMSAKLNETMWAMTDPMMNARLEIMNWSETMRMGLQAMYDGLGTKSPEIVALYQDLMNKINQITSLEMMKNSNKLTDRFGAWIAESSKDIENWAGNITSIFDNAFNGMADVLTDFVMTGKLEWKDFALSVIAEITRMMIKWMMFQALKAVGSMFGIPIPFADGGVMTSGGSMPLKTYSKGGIANSPQLALYGEGRSPEAYVPLPDGRTIPVTLTGMDGMSAPAITNNYVDFDMSPVLTAMASMDSVFEPRTDRLAAADSRRAESVYAEGGNTMGDINIITEVTYNGSGGNGQGNSGPNEYDQKMMQNMSKELSSMIRTTVIEVMQDETRPGGQFNKLGRRGSF